MITPEELNQIGIALFGAVKYTFPEGHMVPLEQVYNVLNAYCSDARIRVETVTEGYRKFIQFRFFDLVESEPVPEEKPALPMPSGPVPQVGVVFSSTPDMP